MKKLLLFTIIAGAGLLGKSAQAQVGVSVGFQIGPVAVQVTKPIAPVMVYDDYYYLPDAEAYYCPPANCYYYMEGGRWITSAYLPGRYRGMDWRNVRHYEIHSERPYMNHDYYRSKFGGYGRDNGSYTNRAPERRDNRGGYGRYQDSPYDSNNDWSRSGGREPQYSRGDNRGGDRSPSRRDDDRRVNGDGGNSWYNKHGQSNGNQGSNWNSQSGRDNGNQGNWNNQPGRSNGNEQNGGWKNQQGRGDNGSNNRGQSSGGWQNGGQSAPASQDRGNRNVGYRSNGSSNQRYTQNGDQDRNSRFSELNKRVMF